MVTHEARENENSIELALNENTCLLSMDGIYFYLGENEGEYIKIISEMTISKPKDNPGNLFLGSTVSFPKSKSYGIIIKNNSVYLLKCENNYNFSFVGQLIPSEVTPF